MDQIADPNIVNAPALDNWRQRMSEILAKEARELSDEEIHILIGRVGYLSNDDRAKFAPVLKRSSLTDTERWRYEHLGLLATYYPEGE